MCYKIFAENLFRMSFYFSLQCCIWNPRCFSIDFFSFFIPCFPLSLLIYALISSSFKGITVLSPFCLWTMISSVTLSFHIFLQGKISAWCLIAIFFIIIIFCEMQVNPSSAHQNWCTRFHTLSECFADLKVSWTYDESSCCFPEAI